MLSERILTHLIKSLTKSRLALDPAEGVALPPAEPGRAYMLYMHVPFCERLCPYCSFNRYPFRESIARSYFERMRKEMLMLEALGYDFESVYVGGGTPTVMMDELCATLDMAREHFSIEEVGCETNPNHLDAAHLEKLKGRVQRMSVGVQSFDDGLLKQMDRYERYGSGDEILERLAQAEPYFDSLNVDMIFNFPSQTEDILRSDLAKIKACGCRQTTFSPLYVSSATVRKMESTLGRLDYERERKFYGIVDEELAGGENPTFRRSTLWTFTRDDAVCAETRNDGEIEEYQTNYTEYPAIGSGSITCLGSMLYVNSFGIREYEADIDAGRLPIMGTSRLTRRDLMRYRFLTDLYKLRLDKPRFKQDFGCDVESGLRMEMAFMRVNRAFERDDEQCATLTPKGRYLTTVMYRQFLSGMNNLRDQARAALRGPDRHILFGDGSESD